MTSNIFDLLQKLSNALLEFSQIIFDFLNVSVEFGGVEINIFSVLFASGFITWILIRIFV